MRDDPTTTESAGANGGSIGWDVDFGTHPLLAPDFLTHRSRLRRSLEQTYERIRADDFAYRRETARRLHYRLLPLMRANFAETNPVPVKAAMALLGRCGADLRPPLGPAGERTTELLREVLKKAGLSGGDL